MAVRTPIPCNNGNPTYTPAEQRAVLAVMRDVLALNTQDFTMWMTIAPHVRGVFAYGHHGKWESGKQYDVNLKVYLVDDEAEALTQLAIMSCDLRTAVCSAEKTNR